MIRNYGCYTTGATVARKRLDPFSAFYHDSVAAPVRLEELAAEELRHLDITTSAFGIWGTGQVNQLAYYDEFARAFRPALLVLVFVDNDFVNNAPILDGLSGRVDPDRLTEVSATRGADGTITLRPPHPPSAESRLARSGRPSSPLARWRANRRHQVKCQFFYRVPANQSGKAEEKLWK